MFEFFTDLNPESSSYFIGAFALLVASFTSLFSVVNPLAAMPVFLSLTNRFTHEERKRTAFKSCLYMFALLVVFLLIGTYVLSFFGISLPGVRIAGGLIIMRAGYSMLNPKDPGKKLTEEGEAAALEKEDISFSPLALPLLSGPGSIAVVIGFASQAASPTDYLVNAISIFLVVLTTFGFLRLAPISAKYIGYTGLNVMTRLMGFIVLAISVQFILSGISQYFNIGV
ncbi:MarC family NAAT transporter [Rhodohalobacter sp. SW132]|uniref:MarC family NAAT transporter n=1 Tax=Rhodohalobacter sp. SW132 TaxID=2293433 RepID=UPI000E223BBA|nr:MarC family NAAT transporter [Rhodohalobacter sp. SW132]REL38785.1 MarC family NAAT transporter [Rhodohalobacter sp. SW132]